MPKPPPRNSGDNNLHDQELKKTDEDEKVATMEKSSEHGIEKELSIHKEAETSHMQKSNMILSLSFYILLFCCY